MTDMKQEILDFTDRVDAMLKKNYETMGYDFAVPGVIVKFGRKNAKLISTEIHKGTTEQTQRSVFCFVEMATGNILKAASWNAPAKHARGNITNEFGGMTSVGPYGANYMK